MDRFNNMVYIGICNYFQTLSTFGYKSYGEVNKLITLLFIEDLLRSSFSEDDYRTITRVLYCLFGSTCLIPYPEFCTNTSLVQDINLGIHRITEDSIVRFSEDEIVRLANQ